MIKNKGLASALDAASEKEVCEFESGSEVDSESNYPGGPGKKKKRRRNKNKKRKRLCKKSARRGFAG